MEIKIKTKEGLVDPIIEIVDGVMIVSPKKEKFEPKDGDVVVCESFGSLQLFICKKYEDQDCCSCYCFYDDKSNSIIEFDESASYTVERYATEEEKQKLFGKLKEEGYEWDAENKVFAMLKWKPKADEVYYYPSMKPHKGIVMSIPKKEKNTQMHFDKEIIDAGWVFKTEEECQAFCDKLNEAINSVKP